MMLQCKQMVWVLPVVLGVGGLIALAPAQQPTITPTAKELNKAFDVDASQWTARFEHEGRAIYDKRYEVLDAMHLRPGMNVADIGAGSGLFARLMAQRVAPGGMVYAVDISKNMIDHIDGAGWRGARLPMSFKMPDSIWSSAGMTCSMTITCCDSAFGGPQ